MIRSIYTLTKLAGELNKKLSGTYLLECFTQEKASLTMLLADDSREEYLHFTSGSQNDSLYIRRGFKRARKNTLDLFDDLLEEQLLKINAINNNRIIKLEFTNSCVYAILFGGNKSNLIATTKENVIFDALSNSSSLIGSKFELPQNELRALRDFDKTKSLIFALSRDKFLFGRQYAEEICKLAQLQPQKKLAELSENDFDLIEKTSLEFSNKLISSDQSYILQNDKEQMFSLVPLLNWKIKAEYDSVNEGIQRTINLDFAISNFEPLKKELVRLLEKEINKTEKLLINLIDADKIKERAKNYRKYGELILAKGQLDSVPGNKVELEDWDGTKVEIPLDEKKTLNENATRYFDKAKDSETQLEINQKRIPKEKLKLEELKRVFKLVNDTEKLKELEKLQIEAKKVLGHKMQNAPIKREDKFRKFELQEGYELFVGKNAANNDELTMKFAKPNDIWLHARGTSGSHAVIRMNKSEKPPKRILEQAGEIVAYYSGAKNAKYAPVAWTYKKYVRKPKGANVGAVTISREEVIMVEPKLPEEF